MGNDSPMILLVAQNPIRLGYESEGTLNNPCHCSIISQSLWQISRGPPPFMMQPLLLSAMSGFGRMKPPNGAAGFHPEYGPDYFAAFVFDPDGYRIEAVLDNEVK